MTLTDEERAALRELIHPDGYDGSVASRVQIVLWWDEGHSAAQVAKMAGTSKPTVYKWIDRYEAEGIDGLVNRKRTGRPREISGEVRARILALTKRRPPAQAGLSHWSSYEMAKYLKRHEDIDVSHNFVSTLWREHGLAPHRLGTFTVSRDRDFAAKVWDVAGLYSDPPTNAVVLSLDEKTQVQAPQRTQPMLPVSFGKAEKPTHDYWRHGTTNLFAALEVKTGKVVGKCYKRRRIREFLGFMNRIVRRYPKDKEIHVVLDNLSTHNNGDVSEWLDKHPNVTFHFTPTGGSWPNRIETWFGIITRQAIRRGSFDSLNQPTTTIENYIKHWNEDAEPFEWSATPDEILAKVADLDRNFRNLVANNS